MTMLSVLIVDDHAVVRRGLRALLESMPDVERVLEAANGADALRLLHEAQPAALPDVVLLDIHMPEMGGLAVAQRLAVEFRSLPYICLTGFEESDTVRASLGLGAAGFLFKDAGADEIERAIRTVVRGGVYLQPAAAMSLAREDETHIDRAISRLTPRETQVLLLVGRGLANKEIADELRISERTARTHVSALLSKLGVRSRTQAAILIAEDRRPQTSR
ncbi:response regulator [Microbacterium elymi]|uniref:Response regulator transcription factor n=1 Tax=Microbacterium elymi TaxID=2909587 RepID=A0ABY5NGQ2_9MICO|nr:response regulator transcription factor [Microbacterium elymi]UUT34347.1 response regulator transcription factor [Microbacterium elymi]